MKGLQNDWRALTDWRAGCGKSARPVRREGRGHIPRPYLYHLHRAFGQVNMQNEKTCRRVYNSVVVIAREFGWFECGRTENPRRNPSMMRAVSQNRSFRPGTIYLVASRLTFDLPNTVPTTHRKSL